MNNDNNNRIRIKAINVLFVGQYAVGKTCLIKNYFGQEFKDDFFSYSSTDYYNKKIKDEESEYKIKVFDFPGTERYMSILYSHLRFSKVIILVFDMTSKESFLHLDRLL